MGFSFDTMRFNGAMPGFPSPMAGLPVGAFLEAAGKSLDRYPSVALDIATIYQGDDLRIYAANQRFASFGGAVSAPAQTLNVGESSETFFAGDMSIPATIGAYRGMSLLLSPSDEDTGPFWRTEIADTGGGWLELRNPVPMLEGYAFLDGDQPVADTSVYPIPDRIFNITGAQFLAASGDYIEIAGYRYRVMGASINHLVIEGGFWLSAVSGTPIAINRWPKERALYGQLYSWEIAADLDVMPTDDQLAGSGITYGDPIAVIVRAIHAPTGAELQKSTAFTIDPPYVVAVALVQNPERRGDGASKIVNLILNRPVIKGNKLKVTASPILANKIGSQYLTGSLEFEPYAASAEAPPPDET